MPRHEPGRPGCAGRAAPSGPHLWLRSARLNAPDPWPRGFPFDIPFVRNLTELGFRTPVTFLVGENGCGKSTLLEAIACAVGSITVGSEEAEGDGTLNAVKRLAGRLKLSWSTRTRRGFFMRSEDFFGFAKRMATTRDELVEDLARVDREYVDRPEARGYARMAYARQLRDIERYYGEGLDAHSHGESYLALFQARFVPGGLYLLDEPEAPLSPTRQLAFLAMLRSMVAQGAQFIIATHSPILMAFPDATILSFDGGAIHAVEYADLEHVYVTRDFLNNPEAYLRHLFEGGDDPDGHVTREET